MAAGLGFKTFTTGEVLTAADTNGYLMQGVLVFASAAARDAAITSPQEGQCCYLKDTDAVLTYSGAAWVGFDDSNAIQNAIVDAKGDLITATAADTPARLAVGTNGQTLVANSSTSTGLEWQTLAGSSGPAFRAYTSTTQSVSASTFTKIVFGAENFDTDSRFTSNDFTPNKAGYYQLNTTIEVTGPTGGDYFYIYKNGSAYMRFRSPVSGSGSYQLSDLMYFNGTTDYANVYWYNSAVTVQSGSEYASFSGVWIRS